MCIFELNFAFSTEKIMLFCEFITLMQLYLSLSEKCFMFFPPLFRIWQLRWRWARWWWTWRWWVWRIWRWVLAEKYAKIIRRIIKFHIEEGFWWVCCTFFIMTNFVVFVSGGLSGYGGGTGVGYLGVGQKAAKRGRKKHEAWKCTSYQI